MHPDPRVQGLLSEHRFFEILDRAISVGLAPRWFHSVRRATGLEDSLGVDGFARIHNMRGQLTQVPFQVKSHPDLIAIHYQDYKVFWMDRLPYFIINPDSQDRLVRERFFEELQFIRRRNEVFHRVERHLAENGVICAELIAEDLPQPLELVIEPVQPSLHIAAE